MPRDMDDVVLAKVADAGPRRHGDPSFLRPGNSAFTLVEILVVVTIIAILAIIGFGFVGNAIERARISKCSANLRGLGSAINLYIADNNGFYPPKGDGWPPIGSTNGPLWVFTVGAYLDPAVGGADPAWGSRWIPGLCCPSDPRKKTGPGSAANSSYALNHVYIGGGDGGNRPSALKTTGPTARANGRCRPLTNRSKVILATDYAGGAGGWVGYYGGDNLSVGARHGAKQDSVNVLWFDGRVSLEKTNDLKDAALWGYRYP